MERLQKILARAGLASRREIETWIQAGRISVNGKLAEIGDKVSGREKIRLDGKFVDLSVAQEQPLKVLLYNKPAGEVCSRDDPEGRTTVFSQLPRLKQGRWIMVGRLDISTSGLLLFTNDGELANRLMHPSYEIPREYAVRVLGQVDNDILQRLKQGVELDDGPAHFNDISLSGGSGANVWYHVTLQEGRNREVRRLWESQGVTVSRLIRLRFGTINLPRYLRRGKHCNLEAYQIQQLLDAVGLGDRLSQKSERKKAVRGKGRKK